MGFPDLYTVQNNMTRFESVKSRKILGEDSLAIPFFSIVIPTYKRGDLMKESVKSALDQEGFDDYEIVIVDNNPDMHDDQTRKALTPLLTHKISYYVNDENIGISGNWNRCIELAKGKYVVMLHDDDVIGPTFLRTVYQAIANENEPGIIGVGYGIFSKTNTVIFDVVDQPIVEQVTKYGFFFNRSINIAGMTFKRDLALSLGGFSQAYSPNIDTCFIYQGLIHSSVINIKQTLAGYRIDNNDSLSGNTMRNIILVTEAMRENLAEHEKFAKVFMSVFDTEFFYHYVLGANKYWKLDLDYQALAKETTLKRKSISKWRWHLFKLFLRINPTLIQRIELKKRKLRLNDKKNMEAIV